MTTLKGRRMDKVEVQLTPKEWAIKIADETRQAPDLSTAIRRQQYRDMWQVFKQLAMGNHPGRKPDDERVRHRLALGYWADFRVRINLLRDVQGTIQRRAEVAGLEVALKLQTLLTMILQDSFSRTARKAAEWVEEYKTADDIEEKNRQGMLAELDAYIVDLEADEGPQSMDLGYLKINFPTKIQVWIDAIKALIFDVFRHQAAVKLIESQYFDGHPILAKDIEASLETVVGKIKDIVGRHNEYLDVRRQLFTAEWDEDEADGVRAGLAGEREGRLKIDIDKLVPTKKSAEELAGKWSKMAKVQAAADVKENEEGCQAAHEFQKEALDEFIGNGPIQ